MLSGRPLIFGAQVVLFSEARFCHAGRPSILAARSSPYFGAQFCYARSLLVAVVSDLGLANRIFSNGLG